MNRMVLWAAAGALVMACLGCASQRPEPGEVGGPPCAVVDGIRVAYTEVGSGRDAVVFVHGWSCDRTFWDAQMNAPELSVGRRLIAIDLPGHGESDKPKIKYTMDLYVRSIAAVMDKAGVERAVLVGHSNGTPMVRQFYREHPDRTAGLVVVDGALKSYFKNDSQWKEFIDPLRGKKYKNSASAMVDGMVKPIGDAALRERIRVAMLVTPQWVMVGAMESVAEPGVWAEDTIKVPTLVVLAQSPFWTPGYEEYVKRLAPRCEYYVMKDASHFLMMEKAAEFDGILERWLKGNGF
jgi:pimeloyl-ACP methyl ester carboxylesterase